MLASAILLLKYSRLSKILSHNTQNFKVSTKSMPNGKCEEKQNEWLPKIDGFNNYQQLNFL